MEKSSWLIIFVLITFICIREYNFAMKQNDKLTYNKHLSEKILQEKLQLLHNISEREMQIKLESELESRSIESKEVYERRLPGCIIIGVRKAGTRALLEYLGIHPGVAIATEEISFFNTNKYYEGLEWYQSQMPMSTPAQVTIEKTPAYYVTKGVAERIHKMNSDIKLILIVRDPVIRLISEYTHRGIHMGLAHGKSFEELVLKNDGRINYNYDAVRTSKYYKFFPEWTKWFKRQQIHIVDGDALITNPLPELLKIERFLGIRPVYNDGMVYFSKKKGFYCYYNNEGMKQCLGSSKGYKHPDVSQDLMDKLTDYYKPFNKIFYNLVNQTFSWPVS